MSNPDRFVDHFKHCNTVDVGLGSIAPFDRLPDTSGLPQSTDIDRPALVVRFVPIPEVQTAIRSPHRRARATMV
jgi:hypothetical protein